jgi:hypothetical protein
MYFFSVTFLFSFIVGVSSPPGWLKSSAIITNFFTWAALDTDSLLVISTHFWIN